MLIDIPANIFDPDRREQAIRDAGAILELPEDFVTQVVELLSASLDTMGVLEEPEQMVDYLNAMERLAILGGVASVVGVIGANQIPGIEGRLTALEGRVTALEA